MLRAGQVTRLAPASDILLPVAWIPESDSTISRDRRILVSPPKDTGKVG